MAMRCARLVAFLLLPSPALAQDAPEIRQFDVATIEKLGHDMYSQDQAVWHATDALLAMHPPAELAQQKVRGWIVDETKTGLRVRYVRDGANEAEKAQVRTRAQVNGQIPRPCSERYNTVALPDPQGDGWLVWGLASTAQP